MHIEILKPSKMAQTGSSLLRIIQNNKTPILDLLVREAIQNSLDAAVESEVNNSVIVDMSITNLDNQKFASNFEGIEKALLKKYSNNSAKALCITDLYTNGLTGPVHVNEIVNNDYGNLYKLIYGIGIPQSKEGAGGSWGYGKTIYFRIGMGLVLYYSRIKVSDNNYEHRLAAAMIEDEKSSESIIPLINEETSIKQGIAWWGEKFDDGSIPITNYDEIKQVLNSVGVSLFEGDETGTKIIIPYIKEDKLLPTQDITSKNENDWNNDISDYLKIAIQRWYAPRIDNEYYPYGKWLDARLNGKRITRENMYPIFRGIQSLYNSTIEGEIPAEFRCKDAIVKSINLHNTFIENSEKNAGKVAFKRFTKNELSPNGNNSTPYELIDKDNLGGILNSPIITFVRKPGMLINYETSGPWCNNIENTEEEEYLIGIFVPHSNSKLKPNLSIPGKRENLEAFLRESEEADHESWHNITYDSKKVTIVSRIQNSVSKIISDTYALKGEKEEQSTISVLSNMLAKELLPPVDYGHRTSSENKKNKVKKTANSSTYKILDSRYVDENKIELNFELQLSAQEQKSVIYLYVASTSGKIKGDDWECEDNIGTKFPLEIDHVSIESNISFLNDFSYKVLPTKKFGVSNSILIEKGNIDMKCVVSMSFYIHDSYIQSGISLETKGEI